MSIAVVGESLVNLVWRAGDAAPSVVAGGSPMNVAVGLSLLGHRPTLVTCWGDDPAGEVVARHLDRLGLVVERSRSASDQTTVALANIDPGSKAATYRFLTAWDPTQLRVPDDAVLLHTGSLAVVVAPGADRVLAACREFSSRAGRAVAVDLNVRPGVEPDRREYRRRVEDLLRVADIVKASDEDLAWLWPERDPATTAAELLAYGPRLVALTRGAAGAVGYVESASVTVAAPRVEVVDTIGAGDAFQACLLAGLVTDDPEPRVVLPRSAAALGELLQRCVVAGALATTRAGAQPPTAAELSHGVEVE